VCVYDEPGGKQRFLKRRRALGMARLHRNENKTVGELAAIFGVSVRTVQRALKTVLGDRKGKGAEHGRPLRVVIFLN
jgi:AraC-like DNA-binding protein